MATKTKKVSSRNSKTTADPVEVLATLAADFGPLDEVEMNDRLEVVLFGILIERVTIAEANHAMREFRANYVDWNEVRISSPEELQEAVKTADDPLETATAVKAFLNRLFYELHHVGLGFLDERNTTEIKSFFKKSASVSEATSIFLLERIREYPALPVSALTMPFIERLGWAQPDSTPLKKQKEAFVFFEREQMLPAFVYLMHHARSVCLPEPGTMLCPTCSLKPMCPFPKKVTAKKKSAKKATKVAAKATKKKAAKKKAVKKKS